MIHRKSTLANRNPTLPPEIARLLAMARARGLHLATGEQLRQKAIVDGTRRDRGLSE